MADLRSYIQGIDLDTTGSTDYVQGMALLVASATGGVLIGGDAANGLDVDVTRVTGTVTVDSELPAAAALADGAANPTTPTVGGANLLWNGTTWDRQKSTIHGIDSTGTGHPTSAMLGEFDDAATSTVTENSFAAVRISSRRAILVEGVASGTNINVNLAASAATVTVDTELDAVAALADAVANPTISRLAAYLVGFNGTTWDRVRTANTGRLQVDVITGGGSDTPTAPIVAGFTSSALAAGSSVALNSAEAAAKKLRKVIVWSSVAYKAVISRVDNAVATIIGYGGGQAYQAFTYDTPHRDYAALGTTAGADNFRVDVTNLDDANAADVYATFFYES